MVIITHRSPPPPDRYLTEQATRHFSPAKDSFDQILLHVMNFEPYEAVKESWELLRWWFAAHLTDLLAHAGLIEDVQLEYTSLPLFSFVFLVFLSGFLATHHRAVMIGWLAGWLVARVVTCENTSSWALCETSS
jgi:hypothetical protein